MIAPIIILFCAAIAILFLLLFIKGRAENMAILDELYRTRQEKDIVIEFLHRTAESLGEGVENEKLYAMIVRATALGCGAMSACIYERNKNGSLTAKAVEGLFAPLTKKINKPEQGISRTSFLDSVTNNETVAQNEGIIGDVARDGKGILIRDASKDPRIIKHADPSLNSKSLMFVPMIFGNQMHGVLAVANPINGKSFSDTDFSLAQSLGEQAGMALHHKEAINALIQKNKLDFDLRLASGVQRYLLPHELPTSPNLEFAVKYIPQQLIGGDFYDAFTLPDGRIGMVIGDVSGKGISAALLMAICQTKLRYIAMGKSSPAETLKELNREVVGSMRLDMFITLIYAIIEKDCSKITMARAGHEQPILCHHTKGNMRECIKLKGRGMAVGMVVPELFDNTIEDISFPFERSDTFLLYTDGLTEASNKLDEEFSTDRLAQTMENLGARSAQDMSDEIIVAVNKFMGRKTAFKDDLTMLAVKRI